MDDTILCDEPITFSVSGHTVTIERFVLEPIIKIVRGMVEDSARERSCRAEALRREYGRHNPGWRPSTARRAEQLVYLMECGDALKIGISVNPELRARRLASSLPNPVRVLATKAGGRYLERELHNRFFNLRINGEWFRRHDAILREFGVQRAVAIDQPET
jgi:hypothetical protein